MARQQEKQFFRKLKKEITKIGTEMRVQNSDL
jgi:hypothetical protein